MNRGVLGGAEFAIQRERITGRGSEKGRIAESEPRNTDHAPGTPDAARTHWPNKAISSQSIGAQWIGIDITTNEAGRANQLRNADWGLRIGNWENGNCHMFGDVFSGAPEGSTGNCRPRIANPESRLTVSAGLQVGHRLLGSCAGTEASGLA